METILAIKDEVGVLMFDFWGSRSKPVGGHRSHKTPFSYSSMSSDSHYVAERAFRQCLDGLHYKGVYCPVAQPVDVEVDPDRAAKSVPVGLEGFVAVGFPTPGQEQRVGVVQLIEAVVLPVKRCALSVEVLQQHLRGVRGEADRLDPPPVAPLTASQRLLHGPATAPVADGQIQDLADAGAGLVSHAYHDLVAQARSSLLESLD